MTGPVSVVGEDETNRDGSVTFVGKGRGTPTPLGQINLGPGTLGERKAPSFKGPHTKTTTGPDGFQNSHPTPRHRPRVPRSTNLTVSRLPGTLRLKLAQSPRILYSSESKGEDLVDE